MKTAAIIFYPFLALSCLPLMKSDTSANGAVIGCLRDLSSGELLSGANVAIENVPHFGAKTIDGKFVILEVPPGHYNIFADKLSFRRQRVHSVQVSPDSATYVELGIYRDAVPEDPIPFTWERTANNVIPLPADSEFDFHCGKD